MEFSWIKPYWALFFIQFVSLSQSQKSLTGNFDLIIAINSDRDGNITDAEMSNFYYSFGGGEAVSRCQFQYRLVEDFGAKPRHVNALYDFMQGSGNSAGTWRQLTINEFKNAIAGGAMDVSFDAASTRLEALNNRIRAALTNPAGNTQGQNNMRYTDFQVRKWADLADMDGNRILSTEEVSYALRSLDMNHDFGIHRCEFIDQMMSKYRQPPITANLMFDLLFKSQEITWADVDSTFLLYRMNRNDNAFVNEERFIEYMSRQNARAAGVVQDPDGTVVPDPGDRAMTLTSSAWALMLATALALVINLL